MKPGKTLRNVASALALTTALAGPQVAQAGNSRGKVACGATLTEAVTATAEAGSCDSNGKKASTVVEKKVLAPVKRVSTPKISADKPKKPVLDNIRFYDSKEAIFGPPVPISEKNFKFQIGTQLEAHFGSGWEADFFCVGDVNKCGQVKGKNLVQKLTPMAENGKPDIFLLSQWNGGRTHGAKALPAKPIIMMTQSVPVVRKRDSSNFICSQGPYMVDIDGDGNGNPITFGNGNTVVIGGESVSLEEGMKRFNDSFRDTGFGDKSKMFAGVRIFHTAETERNTDDVLCYFSRATIAQQKPVDEVIIDLAYLAASKFVSDRLNTGFNPENFGRVKEHPMLENLLWGLLNPIGTLVDLSNGKSTWVADSNNDAVNTILAARAAVKGTWSNKYNGVINVGAIREGFEIMYNTISGIGDSGTTTFSYGGNQ